MIVYRLCHFLLRKKKISETDGEEEIDEDDSPSEQIPDNCPPGIGIRGNPGDPGEQVPIYLNLYINPP